MPEDTALRTIGDLPVDQAGQVVLKETEIGMIPEHWESQRLGEILREPLRNGHSSRESPSGEGVATLTLSAVTQNDFSPRNTKRTVADPRRVRGLWLEAGDILIERANTRELVGLAAPYSGPDNFAIYPDLLVRVRADESRVLLSFLAAFLLTRACREHFQRSARGTAGNMPKIDHGTIESVCVPVPPLGERLRSRAEQWLSPEKTCSGRRFPQASPRPLPSEHFTQITVG